MARKSRITLDEKIDQQKQVVANRKRLYDEAVDELEKLMQKRDEARRKELMEAIIASGKSFEEIMDFLAEKPADNDD